MSKTYDDLFSAARAAYGTGAYDDATLEFLFPQLKESEDERMVRKIESFLSAYGADYFINGELREIEVWLEKQKEQKPDSLTKYVYSKDDKKFIQDCANILVANDYAASAERLLSMFPVRPAEWSEEDESMRWNIISIVGQSKSVQAEEMMDWLKSLCPQPHWKPYEYQIQMLLSVINDPNNAASASAHLALKSLYNDLKKL